MQTCTSGQEGGFPASSALVWVSSVQRVAEVVPPCSPALSPSAPCAEGRKGPEGRSNALRVCLDHSQ